MATKAALLALVALLCLAAVPASARDLVDAEEVDRAARGSDGKYKNDKPLIGILTQACHYCPGRSYVAGGFVKWVEAAGGRPVPIRFYASDDELHRLFKSVNGLIFPGGLTNIWLDDPYVIAARKLWVWAKQSNDAGSVFPVWGTCLGFQLLHVLEANASFTDLFVRTDSVGHASTLDLLPAAHDSVLFRGLSKDLIKKVSDPELNITMENHFFGLPPAHYDSFPALKEHYRILTTTRDRQGLEYVSTSQNRRYPFFATQWHPEKPPYEFGDHNIPHSLDAILVSQHLANVFVDTARQSAHRPESHEEELVMLIYNSKPYFTLKDSVMDRSYDGPDLTYFFDSKDDAPDNRIPVSSSVSFAGRVVRGGQPASLVSWA